jgi:hypothetical protein
MSFKRLAGLPPEPEMLVNVPRLVTAYYTGKPDVSIAAQRVAFGTSGHRGSAFATAFNEDHILAITQAICEYRSSAGIDGPLYLAMDTHALSEPAFASALEVLAANEIDVMIDEGRRRRRFRGRSSGTIAGAGRRSPTVSSSRRRTTRPTTAASSIIRPTAAPPTPRSPRRSKDAPTN